MYAVDRLVAVMLMPFIFAFFLIISAVIIVVNRFSPIFVTKRLSKNQIPFYCLKLQTMCPAFKESDYFDPQKDTERLTKLGRFLRNRGWDELLQIVNIALGQMSFIGPRPLGLADLEQLKFRYPDKVAYIDTWWAARMRVLPGLSGWHQIHLPDRNIIKYDLEYLRTPDLKRNVKILVYSMCILILGKNRFFGREIPDTYVYEL